MQGAVQMAQWYIMNGKNPTLLNVSESIVASQTAEIQQMQDILATLPIPPDCMAMAPSADAVPAVSSLTPLHQ